MPFEISLFTFEWNDVSYDARSYHSLREPHQCFNQAFVGIFPKLAYTGAFSSYTDSRFFGAIGSRLTGTAETTFPVSAVRATVLKLANECGIYGESQKLIIDQKTISQIQGGQSLNPNIGSNSNIPVLLTSDGVNEAMQQLIDQAKDNAPTVLGLSLTTILAIGVGYLILTKRR